MRWIERFDLFLLDLDGLLVNTESLHFEAYKILCARHGYQLAWSLHEYLSVAHASAEGLRNALLPHLKSEDWNVLYSEKKQIYRELLRQGSIQCLPGVESLLKELATARTKRCVVTHSSKHEVGIIKEALPILKTVPVWLTREDYENPKPAPDGYLKAIEILADVGDQVIGFEDSLRGICALKQTLAMPVLICDPIHPQLQDLALSGITHFSSFEKIPKSFRKKINI